MIHCIRVPKPCSDNIILNKFEAIFNEEPSNTKSADQSSITYKSTAPEGYISREEKNSHSSMLPSQ